MAFFDKVTSSVQRLTRRVGGAHSSGHADGRSEEGMDDKEALRSAHSVHETVDSSKGGEYSRMEKRNQKAQSSRNISRNDEWRRRENELNETFRRKLDSLRQRWQMEKSKEMDGLVASLKKKHDNELEATLKRKEKETKVLRTQLRKSQEQLMGRSRSAVLVNATSQDSIKSTRSQDYSHSRGRSSAELANLREQVSDLQQTIKRNEMEWRRKEAEIRTLREQHDAEIQRMARDAQRHIKGLLEELQQKERKIDRLERQVRLSENPAAWNSKQEQGQQERHKQDKSAAAEQSSTEQVVDMKSAASTSSMSSSRMGLGPPTTISKDEYDKDKQRWQQRMSELEAALKKSEESNADLAQSKAEMIRKNKDLEKGKKSLEDFNKKLCDRQKVLVQETKQLEQKLKEAQEEAIRATQACDTVTLECNRLKEKRYNPDRDEELERLRQQNLEYCKCIAALKQTILEKDRRLEVLQQKLRRSKRCRSTIAGERSDDENTRSVNDLDFTASSMSLDTINEDYGEATKEELEVSYRQLANDHVELQNICSSLMRQASTEGASEGSQDLRNRLQEALHRIVQLERNNAAMSPSNVDATWAQEKMKYAALIRAMGEKIQYMEMEQERLQQEITAAKEENELLEFQVLEMEHSQSEDYSNYRSTVNTGRCSKAQCDRSVSTSEDEGHFSMDHSMEDSLVKELPLEELKIRLTLLKHRKELRPDDRHVVAQVKDSWEALQNEHAQCASKLFESEMRLRDTEAMLRAKLEEPQQDKDLSTEDSKKEKSPLHFETEFTSEAMLKLQEENASLKNELDTTRANETQLRSMYTSSVESEERERTATSALRKQLDESNVSRRAEVDILEQASRQQAQNLAAMRTKINDLEKEIDHLKQENRSLSSELTKQGELLSNAQSQTSFKEEELDRLRKMNSEYHGSLAEYKKLESCWTEQRQGTERKYADVKIKFKEAMKLIKEYEQSIGKYVDRLKETAKEKEHWTKVNDLQEKRIADLERELESWNRSGKLSRDDFIACKEVEEQLKAMLKEKTSDLEEKRVAERRLIDEKTKLQKQLQHVKSYSAQLEKQFEMQLQIVQALKAQLLDLQKASREKDEVKSQLKERRRSFDSKTDLEELKKHIDAAHCLLSMVFPMYKDNSPCCCQNLASRLQNPPMLSDQGASEELGMEIWSIIFAAAESRSNEDADLHKTCVKLHSVKDSLDRLGSGLATRQPLEPLKKLCNATIFYNERLSEMRSKVEELDKSAMLFKEEADKANARADMLQRQYHGALLQQTVPEEKETTTALPSDCSDSSPQLSYALERIYVDLKNAVEKMGNKDSEALADFRSKIAKLFLATSEDGACLRTVSPLEQCGSGTESELYDRSPLLSRKRRSANGGGSFRSSSSDDADFKPAPLNASKRGACTVLGAASPPTNVRLAANLRNGRYLICWSPPENLADVKGYKIYVKDEMKKCIGSSHCSKAVVECAAENDWMFINVTALYAGSESIATAIDVERSKEFMQNMVTGGCCSSKSEQRDDRGNRDENGDEDCSEV